MLKKHLTNFLIISFLFFVDRISKIIVLNKTNNFGSSEIYSSEFLNLQLVWNKGIAFGLLAFNENFAYQIITIIIGIIIVVLFIIMNRSSNKEMSGFVLVISGALGNFYDRLFFKAVPDFIDFHYKEFHWFIFNIADIFISIGIFWLILVEIFYKKKNEII
tara:strand:- start:113 stop:595 length:483 start_codon:yes stop_codon:yes gene_type:complete